MSARWLVVEGDLLRGRDAINLGAEPFDAVLSDPPYELGFMGKRWDASGVAFDPKVWLWLATHLRPGAPLLAFGGTRTHHRMMCAIEDAGFEIRDCLSWLYASGFPKSLNISKAIDAAAGVERPVIGEQTLTGNAAVSTKDKGGTFGVQVGTVPPKTIALTGPATDLAKTWDGFGTALKPAWEPIVLARRPLDGTMASSVATHGVGGIAIDACRIEAQGRPAIEPGCVPGFANIGVSAGSRAAGTTDLGRWPANVLLDEASAPMLDAQSGDRPSTLSGRADPRAQHEHPSSAETDSWFQRGLAKGSHVYADDGGASRFFFSSKVSTSERNDGLDDLPELSARATTGRDDDAPGNGPRAGAGRGGTAKNPHPTMKPVALTEYLARLILPPRGSGRPRRLLVPFCGVGSEMIGALRAGWDDVVGIELNAEYAAIARLRLARCDTSHQVALFEGVGT